MSRLCRFFAILIAACTAAGCTPLVGTPLGDIGGQGTPDRFWVVPGRDKYNLNDPFRRNDDLRAFTSHQGVEKRVPAYEVEIGIAEDPDMPEVINYLPMEGDYPLKNKGKKIVVVEYGDMSTSYFIEVSAAGKNGEIGGIQIEWED